MMSLKLLCCVIGLLFILRLAEARLSDEEKEEIVRAHNYYRGKVDPIATNMEQMVSTLRSYNHFKLYLSNNHFIGMG